MKMSGKGDFTFVDLFAGIGGFHQSLKSLGGKCVAASEIDKECIKTYKSNFSDTPLYGDIRKYWDELPNFDVLSGGFPCQPFSKAGDQLGFNDTERGQLFDVVVKILKKHKECKFIILENVRNLSDKTENWEYIQKKLKELNFFVTEKPVILSPSQFGIPQIRERVYILGIRKDIRDEKKLSNGFIHMEELGFEDLPNTRGALENGTAWDVLGEKVEEKYYLSDDKTKILDVWDEFRIGTKFSTSGVPIWIDYMGIGLSDDEYSKKMFYQNKNKENSKIDDLPLWKQKFAKKNRVFYLNHKKFIDTWSAKYSILNEISTYKKFEWNCGEEFKSLKEVIIQFRHSGIRAKKPTYFPTLVAINNTPIIWDQNVKKYRYITPREAANLQNFEEDYKLGNNDTQAYKQLGNSVNVEVVRKIFEKLYNFAITDWRKK